MQITIENLKKSFGDKVAVNINHFEIPAGQILGIVGNNGAGKSTLFRLMLDLIKSDEGRVMMDNIDVSKTEEWKNRTGAFVDESFLIDYLTPDEYFHFITRISCISENECQDLLKRFEHFMAGELSGEKKLIRNLSAGNKQKVGIISAMLLRPEVLILDEPFNFLDPSSQSAIKHIIKEYNREMGATILISSHNLQHTVDICPRIALMEHGVIHRDIDNTNGQAQQELEHYFEIS